MMIQVKRKTFTTASTCGEMWVDGEFECYTLEDEMREKEFVPVALWKVGGKSAIPVGTYDVVIDRSARFNRLMPHILNVPGFTGVRIHCGNTAADTEGCILVGAEKTSDYIGHSKLAFESFFPQLQDAIQRGERCTVTVTNEQVLAVA